MYVPSLRSGGVTAIVAEADFVVSVADVAVTVTVFPVGTVAGAWYAVATPVAVAVGVNEPHAPPLQVTDHVTPPSWVSLVTTAVRLAVLPTSNDVGGAGVRLTEIAAVVEPEFEPELEFVLVFEFEPESEFEPEFEVPVLLPLPPQPADHTKRSARLARRIGCRNLIELLLESA
jgi:hypothetical protein